MMLSHKMGDGDGSLGRVRTQKLIRSHFQGNVDERTGVGKTASEEALAAHGAFHA